MKLREWLSHARARLEKAGISSSMLEAQMLLAHRLGVERSWILAHLEDFLESLDLLEEDLQRREHREPLAYILGSREFYGRKFRVSPDVLIPRHETEVLVDAAKEVLPPGKSGEVLDVGTGSGCIAITLKVENPLLRVTGVDCSPGALRVAAQNAKDLHADVEFLLSDNVKGLDPTRKFHLIVSNPPYIQEGYALEPEVALHEPWEALFAGPEGLDFYRRLALESSSHLEKEGILLVEIGFDQNEKVRRLFEEHGWRFIKAWEDLSGTVRVLAFKVG
jgi:release factor glutamine methyltransferase